MNSDEIIAKLEAVISRRQTLFDELRSQGTTAFRLFHGPSDGVESLSIDLFDEVGIFQILGQASSIEETWKPVASWLIEKNWAKSVYVKLFEPERFKKSTKDLVPTEPLAGDRASDSIVCLENNLKFVVKPSEGFSTGLFLDQRENRKFLAKQFAGLRVLNGFSYTCAFSVAVAARGASVASVDVSKKALEWGKQNFQLNEQDLTSHRFYADDMFEFYRRAAKRGDRFDAIILDPPSFSRNAEGEPFSVERDWRKLIEGAQNFLEPHGFLFFSSNLLRWDSAFLCKMVRDAFTGWDRKTKLISLPPAPPDFGGRSSLSCVLLEMAR